MNDQETLELYQEYPEPNEDEIAQKIVRLTEEQMVKNFPTGRTLRDVHSKGHGCVRAEFIIEPGLPEELRVGVFKDEKTFPALIRFSNAGALAPIGGTAADAKVDVRGMAIKLLGVAGRKLLEDESDAETQDFLLITASTFITKGPAEFYDLMVAQATSTIALSWFMLAHPRVGLEGYRSLDQHADLLDLQYFSALPFSFGAKAVKYSAKPSANTLGSSQKESELPDDSGDDYLRNRLKQRLAREEVRFDFMVQFQTDPYAMPIENAQVLWDEERSPFIKVASIGIPRQTFDAAVQVEFCDNLSFKPWHSLPEHRPLGSINRARRIIYKAISNFRHERNAVRGGEPTVDSLRQFAEAQL